MYVHDIDEMSYPLQVLDQIFRYNANCIIAEFILICSVFRCLGFASLLIIMETPPVNILLVILHILFIILYFLVYLSIKVILWQEDNNYSVIPVLIEELLFPVIYEQMSIDQIHRLVADTVYTGLHKSSSHCVKCQTSVNTIPCLNTPMIF